MLYDLIRDGKIVETRDFDRKPDPNPVKNLDWRPRTEKGLRPDFDSATHHAPEIAIEIQADRTVERWLDPVAKTESEKVADEDRRKESELDAIQRALFKITLNHENRIRALEGKVDITAAQLRKRLRALL